MPKPTIQELAAEARPHFVRHKRKGDDEIWTIADDAPRWISDLSFAAHDSGRMLPDDWRYEFIVDALDALEECVDPDDASIEADDNTSSLCEWLASRVDRTGYVNDAIADAGDGFSDIVNAIQMGQQAEKDEVLGSVRSFLEERADSLETPDPVECRDCFATSTDPEADGWHESGNGIFPWRCPECHAIAQAEPSAE